MSFPIPQSFSISQPVHPIISLRIIPNLIFFIGQSNYRGNSNLFLAFLSILIYLNRLICYCSSPIINSTCPSLLHLAYLRSTLPQLCVITKLTLILVYSRPQSPRFHFHFVDYKTISGVNGPLVILDNVKAFCFSFSCSSS